MVPSQPGVPEVLVVMILETYQSQRVPWLHLAEDAPLGVRVSLQEMVEPRSVRIVQATHPLGGALVLLDGAPRDLEPAGQVVVEQRVFAVEFGAAADCPNEVVLHLPPVVLRLGVRRTKDDAGVGGAEDMRDPPLVALNRHPIGGCGR